MRTMVTAGEAVASLAGLAFINGDYVDVMNPIKGYIPLELRDIWTRIAALNEPDNWVGARFEGL